MSTLLFGKSLLVGLAVAAPLGPIGALCINRTLERGFWAGITLYPNTKVSPMRAVDMIEVYGADRICVASACDWGPSEPVAIPHFVLEMRRRGHPERLIRKVVYENPIAFLGQSPKFQLREMI